MAVLPSITRLLADKGFSVRTRFTSAEPDSAAALARAACVGSALVVACGGDGTVHGVLQAVTGTTVPLGVLPSGTANALARHLRLPLDPLRAMTQLLTYTPRRVTVGEMSTAGTTRFFLVMAGCGPDGALVHGLEQAGRLKARYGRAAYYVHAARLFLTRRWPAFQVSYRLAGATEWQETRAVAVMVSRIPNLGGVFRGLTRGASLEHGHLQVQVVRPPAWVAFPAWFTAAWLRAGTPWVRTLNVEEIRCEPQTAGHVYVQADAEPLGALPCRMRVVPDALTLLLPPG